MKTLSLHIRLKSVEGALVRLLGLVMRRGFRVVGMEARQSHCGGRFEVALDVSGHRSPVTLERQIAKLYDVENVQVLPAVDVLPAFWTVRGLATASA
jgi:acetolactate synthase regulatory subunit